MKIIQRFWSVNINSLFNNSIDWLTPLCFNSIYLKKMNLIIIKHKTQN